MVESSNVSRVGYAKVNLSFCRCRSGARVYNSLVA